MPWYSGLKRDLLHMLSQFVEYLEMKTDVTFADCCSNHFQEEVFQVLEKIGNVKMIAILPHPGLLAQVLDCSVLASLIKLYSSIPMNQNFSSCFTRKFVRIKKAYVNSINSELIRAAWE